MSQYITLGPSSNPLLNSVRFLEGTVPSTPASGTLILYAKNDDTMAYKTSDGTEHVLDVGTPGVSTMAAVGSSPNANGASISGITLTLQPADATHPGVLTSGTQTIGGAKTLTGMLTGVDGHFVGTSDKVQLTVKAFTGQTSQVFEVLDASNNPVIVADILGNFQASGDGTFTGSLSALNLSGTNTGNIDLSAVGASPSANGATLSGGTGQTLTLQPADGTHPGLMTAGTQTIGGDKTFSGSIIASTLTANRAMVSNASKILTSSATTDTEIGYVSGVTSSIQTQINNKVLQQQTFTASGNWVCPAGVTEIILFGRGGSGGGGGGGGGAGGSTTTGSGGGGAGASGGSCPSTMTRITVVPTTNYTITIGAAGTAGTGGAGGGPAAGGATGTAGTAGTRGGTSSFDALAQFPGGFGGGGGSGGNLAVTALAGGSGKGQYGLFGAVAGNGGAPNVAGASNVGTSFVFFDTSASGAGGTAGGAGGGGGGGAGPGVLGADSAAQAGTNGGNAGASGANGSNAATANASAGNGCAGSGGGGGGGGGTLAVTGTTGGNGANGTAGSDGQITVQWLQ